MLVLRPPLMVNAERWGSHREHLDAHVGWPDSGVREIRFGLSRRHSICCYTEGIDDIGAEKVRIAERKGLGHSVLSKLNRVQKVVIRIECRRSECMVQQIPAKDRVVYTLLKIDTADRHVIVF